MLAVASLIAAAALAMLAAQSRLAAASGPGERAALAHLQARSGPLRIEGVVEPVRTAAISSLHTGMIRKVHVAEADRVEAGQILIEFETDEMEARIMRAESRVAAARARLQEMEAAMRERARDMDRKSRLAARQILPQRELDASQGGYERAAAMIAAAAAEVLVAEAELSLERIALSRTRILAPFAGTILSLEASPGLIVRSDKERPMALLAADLATVSFAACVPDAVAVRLVSGARAGATVPALPGRRFEAQVSTVSLASEPGCGPRTFKAVLSAANPDRALRPGMAAVIEFPAGPTAEASPYDALDPRQL